MQAHPSTIRPNEANGWTCSTNCWQLTDKLVDMILMNGRAFLDHEMLRDCSFHIEQGFSSFHPREKDTFILVRRKPGRDPPYSFASRRSPRLEANEFIIQIATKRSNIWGTGNLYVLWNYTGRNKESEMSTPRIRVLCCMLGNASRQLLHCSCYG
jgi:hypothetical protein